MSELIESYLSKLESRLSRKLTAQEVAEHLREVRSHLSESVANLKSEGDHSAELTALRRLGSDKLLSENLTRARKGLDSKSSWRFILLPSLCLAVFGISAEVISLTGSLPEFILVLLRLLPTLLLILVALAVFRSRRLLIGPLAATFSVIVLCMAAVESIWGPFGTSGFSAERRKEEIAGFNRYISELENKVAAGKEVMAGKAFPVLLKEDSGFVAPKLIRGRTVAHDPLALSKTTTNYSTTFLSNVSTEAEARALWIKNGHAHFNSTDRKLAMQRDLLSQWTGEKIFPSPLTIAKNILVSGIYGMIAVFIVCFLSLGLVRAREEVLVLVWNPERIRA